MKIKTDADAMARLVEYQQDTIDWLNEEADDGAAMLNIEDFSFRVTGHGMNKELKKVVHMTITGLSGTARLVSVDEDGCIERLKG
jgi:hypothetical protein